MKASIREKIMSHGVGESKLNVAPEGAFPENKMLDCHVGGVLVRELPLEVQGAILYRQTDEGVAEFNQGKVEARACVTSDPLDKIIDSPDDSPEPWESIDPMQELVTKHIKPGMKGKFLSPRKCSKDGMRGHVPVKDANGDVVKLGTMILGQMPAEKAARRNETYRRRSDEERREIVEDYMVKQESLVRDANLRPGEALHDVRGPNSGVIGLHSERGQ